MQCLYTYIVVYNDYALLCLPVYLLVGLVRLEGLAVKDQNLLRLRTLVEKPYEVRQVRAGDHICFDIVFHSLYVPRILFDSIHKSIVTLRGKKLRGFDQIVLHALEQTDKGLALPDSQITL